MEEIFVIPAILVSTVLLVWVTVNGTSVKGATSGLALVIDLLLCHRK